MPYKHLNINLDQLTLKELLYYNPETGIFTWLKTGYKGNRAGYEANTCRIIMLFQKNYKEHRLAWLYMTGNWPKLDIDHKDGNWYNNKWNNLREATESQNLGNQKRSKNNKSGVKGVSWDKINNQWRVNITVNKKIKNLGRYNTLDEAKEVYKVAAEQYFGEFARLE